MDKIYNWKQRWINPKAKPFNSPIHALGGIAAEPIAQGEIICIFGGIIVPASEIEKYREKIGHAGIQIDDNFFICPTSREDIENTLIFNHSCGSNCGMRDIIKLVAMRAVKEGEELTVDYAVMESNYQSFQCNCKSSNCRGTVKPTDWKIPELQEKYKGYFSPYIMDKILRSPI
jgi:SET domain-containing protein